MAVLLHVLPLPSSCRPYPFQKLWGWGQGHHEPLGGGDWGKLSPCFLLLLTNLPFCVWTLICLRKQSGFTNLTIYLLPLPQRPPPSPPILGLSPWCPSPPFSLLTSPPSSMHLLCYPASYWFSPHPLGQGGSKHQDRYTGLRQPFSHRSTLAWQRFPRIKQGGIRSDLHPVGRGCQGGPQGMSSSNSRLKAAASEDCGSVHVFPRHQAHTWCTGSESRVALVIRPLDGHLNGGYVSPDCTGD